MSRTLKRRLRGTSLLLTLAAMMALIIYIACSNSTTPYAPLGKDTPKSGSGDVVSGSVRDQGTTAVKGAIVSIEALTNGVPATALALMEHPELAGKFESRAATTSDATHRVTLTDANGRFYFDGMTPGEYAIQVQANDHLGGTANVAVPNTPQALDTIIVDVNLTPTGTFSGVATLENGAVHQDIVVFCQGTSYVAVTNPTGAYAITDVPVGSRTIRATKSHYIDDTKNGTLTFAGQNLGLPAMLLKIDNNIAPVATVTIPPQSMAAGSPVTFQASGTDLDGTVVLYEWDWENDGTMDASSASPGSTNHTYATPGNYTVKLRVTDNLGAIGLDAKVITINPSTIYMATTGSDLNNGLTTGTPVKTVLKAYQIASLNSVVTIKATSGTYNEVPNFQAGISVLGGYDATFASATGLTTFSVGTSRATANGITVATTISRVEVTTTNAPVGSNSIALLSMSCSSQLAFNTCTFRASNAGTAGPDGSTGTAGTNGGIGVSGGVGACDGAGPGGSGGPGGVSASCPGGAGGAGGNSGGGAQNGFQGACTGGSGGFGGLAGDPGQWGANGIVGVSGANGSPGTASNVSGSYSAGDWLPTNGGAGTAATDGKGGGGGGGGGGQSCTFCTSGPGNGGGGGGGGGTGGGLGGGGLSGYGSIGVLLVSSSPTFQNCAIFAANGGAGRNGGNGANGGTGGSGGLGGSVCTGEVGKGGNGGNGGNGGGGGGGAGGAGGPSICIMRATGSVPVLSSTVFNVGLGGTAGTGGTSGNGGSPAPNGSAGLVQATYIVP